MATQSPLRLKGKENPITQARARVIRTTATATVKAMAVVAMAIKAARPRAERLIPVTQT
ncbi:hypothetical protein D3C85_1877330 [compost metagenome]